MTSKKCQSKATVSEANGGTASTTPPLPQAPVPPSELAITTASGSVVSQQQPLQPPLLTLRPMRPDSTASSASASSLGTAASAATHSSQSLTITPLMSPQVSLPTEPEPPNSLAFLGGTGTSGLPMTVSKDNPHFLAAMAASAMALSNPLLLNPLLFSTSMMQNSVAAAAAASNGHGLDSASDLIKSMKSFLPQLPMPMMSLWSMMGTAGTVPQFKKPTIADTFAGLPGFADEEVANIRNLLETVNASVTKSLLEDNLKKWASTCGLSTDEILQQLAQAQPLSPAQLLHPKNHQDMDEDMMDLMSDDEVPSMKKASASSSLASNSSRPRALISDDQVATLKAYYSINAKPRREELLKLCEEIGHPFKVVKVWFQNTRARDRRELAGNAPTGNTNNSEGQQNSKQPTLSFPTSAFNNAKHLLPPTPPASCSTGSQKHPSPVPSPVAIGMIKDEIMDEEEKVPLDLSTKSSTPSASPPPLVINSEVITNYTINFEKKNS